ncbi:2,3-diphosphoglycerate-dependent phosphoglycerate mutase [Paenarthrobacter sp. NPDC089989]|uniref:2,3-bisphosphoglycerate-dependent phosphoglycerate mutase n=1 Tax=unclassified Paenarthrobacter TaxID=2634190 RepID=UPI003818F9BF
MATAYRTRKASLLPGALILLRHGTTVWHEENRFTGWADVPLSSTGIMEAHRVGELLSAANIFPDVAHTSRLVRSIQTANHVLAAAKSSWVDSKRTWRLNERHYGLLQGQRREDAVTKYGGTHLDWWRRSWEGTPPPSRESVDPFDPRYGEGSGVPPMSESLRDVSHRVLPYWENEIKNDLRRGKTVLVVAHSNSLRAIVRHLDRTPDEDLAHLNIPIASPLIYRFDSTMAAVSHNYLSARQSPARKTEVKDLVSEF